MRQQNKKGKSSQGRSQGGRGKPQARQGGRPAGKSNNKFSRSPRKKVEFSEAVSRIPNVLTQKNKILTRSNDPGNLVYGEYTSIIKGDEYREWDPKKSKLCAGLFNGLNNISLKEDTTILYLGSSTGTTVSHLSDIVTTGKIFALDFAPRVHRELIFLAKDRDNIYPMLADITQPESYFEAIPQVDFLFQDVAQKNQLMPFVQNILLYLKKNGVAMISVKARSIDVTKRPDTVFKEFGKELEKHMNIMEKRLLDPYEKDHCLFVVKQKK